MIKIKSLKLDELALSYTGAIISVACILLFGVFGNRSFYIMPMMRQWSLGLIWSPFGILVGLIQAAIIGFIVGYAVAWMYNKFAK